jgi:serine/threonine protein kinase/formylglycine-generating enzyme required for sulfatase activity
MDAQRWLVVDDLFQAALAVERSERARVLRARAGADAALLAEVESLLAAHERGSSVFDAPVFDVAGSATTTRAQPVAPGKRIGKYTLRGVIGHGGSGIVYEAEQDEPSRVVALKVLRAAPFVDEWTPRLFRREAAALARLQHPGIAAVYDAGLAEDGSYYFAMERVEGLPLTAFVSAAGLDVRQRLELFRTVCEAVHYAHQRGVIHRDLKPSNILVTSGGRPKVLDFGLARITDLDGQESRITEIGVFLGTLAYASPEQLQTSAGPGEVDLCSDVYSLGVILFEVLSGARPYEIGGLTLPEAARVICETPPRALGAAAPALRGDLATIVHKALEKDPARRYSSAAAFGEDVTRYLAGDPILAHPPSTVYQLRKLVARHRLPFGLASSLLVVVIGAAIALGALASRAMEQRTDLLRLSALQELEELLQEGNTLWPPYPERIPAYQAWISKAQALVDDLPLHEKKRSELRSLALPQSEQERLAERESHPDFGRVAELTGVITSKGRALLQRRDGVAAELPEVDWSSYPTDAGALNNMAWSMIAPERKVLGKEPLGLVLALRALELGGEDPALRDPIDETVAWAYFALGRDAEATAVSRAAALRATAAENNARVRYLADIEIQATARSSPDGLRAAEAELERHEAELAALESRLSERRNWRFPDEHSKARWWEAQLTQLIAGLEDVASKLLADSLVTPNYGWSMSKRLGFAQGLASDFAPAGRHSQVWERVLPAIRAAHPGLAIEPQMGLLPIGPDPATGLWEFAHLMTGAPAERGADGRLVLREATGVVLILIPGGRFWMGAQPNDPAERNYDQFAGHNEAPVHQVELSAHLLSKYELTQGQWKRVTGHNQSGYGPESTWGTAWLSVGVPSLLHPVEQVTWLDCMRWLRRMGLALPTEAQWEHGARGGTGTPWWTGAEKISLAGAANLRDSYARDQGFDDTKKEGVEAWLDDGVSTHAAVGSYRPNNFGLHDVAGNVSEWCLDGWQANFYGESSEKDPVAPMRDSFRAYRGGYFSHLASEVRSAYRRGAVRTLSVPGLGVRPARGLDR